MPLNVYDLATSSAHWAYFYEQMAERSLPAIARDGWATESIFSPEGFTVVFRDYRALHDVVVLREQEDKWVADVQIEGGQVNVAVAARDLETGLAGVRELRKKITPLPSFVDGKRPVTFWVWANYGPESATRLLEVPKWTEVRDNYTASDLEDLMTFRPSTAGQLILWRGEPGCGKTYALRALLWEWREWASFHYIVDPDIFFGTQASYLTRVLMHEESNPPSPEGLDDLEAIEEKSQSRWKVLILEDCGELLSKDARERAGQGLSRLLNVVDGLIGQGLRVLVLVTTNEELGALHNAIQRPGRCAANIEFEKFSRDSAITWLDERGYQGPVPVKSLTLAELYAILEGRGEQVSDGLVGFAA